MPNLNKAETLYGLVKNELGFSRAEADHYLTIHGEAGLVVVKLRAKSYMEPTTWNAFIALMKQSGAVHEKENSPTFEIPIQTSRPKPTVTPQEEATTSYSLASSKEGLGELVPVLVDKFHNIIDGFHRKGENANWREEVLDWIDTPEKLEAARLAVNFARRQMAPEEIKERISFLISKGMKPLQISKLTGINERTVYKYTPQDVKNPQKVEAGRAGGVATAQKSADTCQFTNVKAEPSVSGETGSYLDRFAECSGCHLMLYTASLVDGKCPTCREREARQQKTPQKVAIDAEPPVDAEAEIREALGQPEMPKKNEPIVPQLPTLACALGDITFLITPPPVGEHSIQLTKEKLEQLFTEHDYDGAGLTLRKVEQTADGLTVTFNMAEWLQSTITFGAPSGSINSCLFEAELKSLLSQDTNFDPDEVDQLTVKQLHPTEQAPEVEQKKSKAVREIDWNAQGVSCPCCGCTISQEKYQRLKEKFSKYPGLFAE